MSKEFDYQAFYFHKARNCYLVIVAYVILLYFHLKKLYIIQSIKKALTYGKSFFENFINFLECPELIVIPNAFF